MQNTPEKKNKICKYEITYDLMGKVINLIPLPSQVDLPSIIELFGSILRHDDLPEMVLYSLVQDCLL